jgi:hypothetical protein
MPSGWDVYYLVFLSAAMALLIPLGLGVISLIFFPQSRSKGRQLPSADADAEAAKEAETHDSVGKRVNVRFFLGINAALVLIALVLGIIPSATAIHAGAERGELMRSLFALISIAALASLGLLYSVVKGDLSWLKSFQGKGR